MLPRQMARQVEEALRDLRYGTVQLIVHDAQVVRIERVERIRVPADPEQEDFQQTHG